MTVQPLRPVIAAQVWLKVCCLCVFYLQPTSWAVAVGLVWQDLGHDIICLDI